MAIVVGLGRSWAAPAWLVSQAEHCDGKIVLVGDPKQLPSIDSGGLFHRIVAEDQGVVTDLAAVNQRQTLDLDRQVLDQLRQGRVALAVHEYGQAGRLHLGGDEYTTKTALVDAWWTDAQTHCVDQVRMLASRRDEVALLNQLARVRMQAEGFLHGPALVNRWGMEPKTLDALSRTLGYWPCNSVRLDPTEDRPPRWSVHMRLWK